jgi:type VII secretion protein EccB
VCSRTSPKLMRGTALDASYVRSELLWGERVVREPTTRLAVSGHRFLLRRIENALLRRDARMIDEPLRAQARSMLTGGVLAVVAVAACVIIAFIRPQETLGDAQIAMVKGSGALYVRVGDTLHPVVNLASARLIAGSALNPVEIGEAELRKAKRGPLLGIPGAPAVLPEPLGADQAQWAVCDSADGTTVIAGPLDVGISVRLDHERTMVVRSRTDSQTYLLYDGRRARVSPADRAAVKALRLDGIAPSEVSAALLNAIPETTPITAPIIAEAGQRGPASLGGLPVGSVVRVSRAEGDELYVVLSDGVQRIGNVAADLIRFSDSQGVRDIVAVAADAVSAIPAVETLPVATLPDKVTTPVRDATVCAQWVRGRTAVWAGSRLPLAEGQGPVSLAQADGVGPNADAVFVPAGRCLDVESTHRYLVTDTGVRFAVRDPEAAAALGFTGMPTDAPWPILKLLADGPELSRAAALVAHDGMVDVVSPVPSPAR